MIKKRGITFLEIVITMGIFLIFISLAYPFFISNLRSDIKSEAVADLQIEGNKAKEYLTRLCMEAYSIRYDKKDKVWEFTVPSNEENDSMNKKGEKIIKIATKDNSMKLNETIIANYIKNINITINGYKSKEITITIDLAKKVSGLEATSKLQNVVYSRNMN